MKGFRPAIPHDNYGIMVARNQAFPQVGSPLKPSQLLISGFGVRVPGGAPPNFPADLRFLWAHVSVDPVVPHQRSAR